jgi:hypothetical protein
MPEAVRISVSMCSFSTGARAGSSEASSASVACRHTVFFLRQGAQSQTKLPENENRLSS